MFDFLRRNQPSPKSIERLVKRLTEPGGEEGPRVEAAEKLAEWGTPESLYALLKRFTMSSKVITQDIEEKRYVERLLVEKGDDAVAPILQSVYSGPPFDSQPEPETAALIVLGLFGLGYVGRRRASSPN